MKISLYSWNRLWVCIKPLKTNLQQVIKNQLPKIVTTFLVLFSDGNHKLTTWMESWILSYFTCKISSISNVWNCSQSHLKSPGWGNHGKGNQKFTTLSQHLFLNQVTISTGSFSNFYKFMTLIAATLDFGHHNFASFYGCFSAAHWKCHKMVVNFVSKCLYLKCLIVELYFLTFADKKTY